MLVNIYKKKINHRSAFSLIEVSIVLIIIGLLVAGVTAGQRLIVAARLSTAKAVTESSPVSSIRGLTMWMDSVSDLGFSNPEDIEEGDDLPNSGTTPPGIAWKDINTQSGKINFTGLPGSLPSYSEQTLNSLPAITFNPDADDNERLISSTNIGDLSSTSFTIFILAGFSLDSSGSVSTLLQQEGGAAILYKTSGDVIASDLHTTAMTMGTATFAPEIYTLRYSNGGNLQMFLNGALITTTAATIPSSTQGWIIGSNDAATLGEYFIGNVGEVIFFDRRLRISEINAVHEYLSQKWQIDVAESTN